MQENFVEFNNVYKRYKMGEVTINAANGVSFSINEGEFAVVVGLSGAGKTTVLNILGGIDNCDEGRIVVGGKDISRLTGKELASYRRYDIGFVFQFYNLIPNLTAKENVELATQICRDSIDAATALEKAAIPNIFEIQSSASSISISSNTGITVIIDCEFLTLNEPILCRRCFMLLMSLSSKFFRLRPLRTISPSLIRMTSFIISPFK